MHETTRLQIWTWIASKCKDISAFVPLHMNVCLQQPCRVDSHIALSVPTRFPFSSETLSIPNKNYKVDAPHEYSHKQLEAKSRSTLQALSSIPQHFFFLASQILTPNFHKRFLSIRWIVCSNESANGGQNLIGSSESGCVWHINIAWGKVKFAKWPLVK